jgi:hypothetical protein
VQHAAQRTVRLIDPVTLVRGFQMRSTPFAQLKCISLDSTPDTAAVDVNASLNQQFGDMLVGERIVQIPTHRTTRRPTALQIAWRKTLHTTWRKPSLEAGDP